MTTRKFVVTDSIRLTSDFFDDLDEAKAHADDLYQSHADVDYSRTLDAPPSVYELKPGKEEDEELVYCPAYEK